MAYPCVATNQPTLSGLSLSKNKSSQYHPFRLTAVVVKMYGWLLYKINVCLTKSLYLERLREGKRAMLGKVYSGFHTLFDEP